MPSSYKSPADQHKQCFYFFKLHLGRPLTCFVYSFQRPVQCFAVGMVSTSKAAACVTAVGKDPNVMFPPTSASTLPAVDMAHALWGLVSVILATKGRTAKKVPENVVKNTKLQIKSLT